MGSEERMGHGRGLAIVRLGRGAGRGDTYPVATVRLDVIVAVPTVRL